MANQLCYFYVPTVDKNAAEKFYGELFDWTFSAGNTPEGLKIENVQPAGAVRGNSGASANSVQAYFSVDNIDTAINKVRQLGGVADEVIDNGASGRSVVCRDDQGTQFNLWQPAV